MGGLTSALSIAITALGAQQSAINVTSNNVANVNTPGFTRQRPIFTENDPVTYGDLCMGTGVDMSSLQSVRDKVLDLRIQDEEQEVGHYDALAKSLQNIETVFGNSGTSLDTDLSKFFSSLSTLSTDPGSLSLRQAVLTSANHLTGTFHSTAQVLQQNISSLDRSVAQSVGQINELTGEIAGLNQKISAMQTGTTEASVLVDQRQQLIEQLSGIIDISVVPSESQISITTRSGTLLLAGNVQYSLDTQRDSAGLTQIISQGDNVTSQIRSGSLAGYLQARDQIIPSYLSSLDALAGGLAAAFNLAHEAGYDLAGNRNIDLFDAPPPGNVGAAGVIRVAITDAKSIAASSDPGGGGNGNLATLLAIRGQSVAQNQNPVDFYSNLVFRVGADVQNAQTESDGAEGIAQQLKNQRGSVSGVSLDEEAANLMRYQRAYEAAARIINIINELTGETVNLGSS